MVMDNDGLLGQYYNWINSPLTQSSNSVIMTVWIGGFWKESEP